MLTPAAIESRVLEQWTQLRERQSSHPLEPARVVIAEMMCLGYKPKYMHGVVQRAGIAVSYSVLWKWIKRTFGSGQARIPCARAILQQAVDADLFVSSVVRKSSVIAPIGVSVPNAISSLTHPPRPQAPSAAANLAKRRQGDVGGRPPAPATHPQPTAGAPTPHGIPNTTVADSVPATDAATNAQSTAEETLRQERMRILAQAIRHYDSPLQRIHERQQKEGKKSE